MPKYKLHIGGKIVDADYIGSDKKEHSKEFKVIGSGITKEFLHGNYPAPMTWAGNMKDLQKMKRKINQSMTEKEKIQKRIQWLRDNRQAWEGIYTFALASDKEDVDNRLNHIVDCLKEEGLYAKRTEVFPSTLINWMNLIRKEGKNT